MRKTKRYIIRNWFWITVGFILTKFAIEKCYEQREGFFIGGEWFILPVIFMVKYLISTFVNEILNVF